jgi:hypothetical protein
LLEIPSFLLCVLRRARGGSPRPPCWVTRTASSSWTSSGRPTPHTKASRSASDQV